MVTPAKKASYVYEGYREEWHLLKESRAELLHFATTRHHHRTRSDSNLAPNGVSQRAPEQAERYSMRLAAAIVHPSHRGLHPRRTAKGTL